MPIDLIPKSLYPFVGKYAGVPALLRSGARILDTITLGLFGIGDALSQLIGEGSTGWGVFDPSGQTIADYDSVHAVEYQNSSKLSNYPLEQGAFASYNKVETPFGVRVTLRCGGDLQRRAQFLAAMETARRGLLFFTVVTPEYTYQNVNFTELSVRRTTAEGAGIIIAELTGEEVRQRANAAYSAPKDASGYGTSDLGQVQTVDDSNIDVSGVV